MHSSPAFVLNKISAAKSKHPVTVIQIRAWRKLEGFVHGFTVRTGGVSPRPYSSLNFGTATGDTKRNVRENLRILASCLGFSPRSICTVKQVHGARLLCINSLRSARALCVKTVEADGIITHTNGPVAAIKTADCVPLLLVGKGSNVAAVVHAGWRGTAQGIAAAAVNLIAKKYGCAPRTLHAAIGPAIGPCCFKVDGKTAGHFPRSCKKKAGTDYKVDLWKTNYLQLREAGLRQKNISVIRLCTSCNSALFFSHRRDKGNTGRMLAFAGWN